MRPKKGVIIAVLLLLALAAGFLYLKYGLLKVKDYQPDVAKARSPVDLRPSLIAKLQQLVRDGSDSLYTLSIDTLDPDIVASTLDARSVRLQIDSQGYRRLLARGALPDEVYSISFNALHIDGIGLEDLIKVSDIKLKRIYFEAPHIEAWYKEQPYNRQNREREKHTTLYQRLTKSIHSIAIGNIGIEDATYVFHNETSKAQVVTFPNVSIKLVDILVDSATQYAQDRMLFASQATMQCRDYTMLTPDSLYKFRVGRLNVSAEEHSAEVTALSLIPYGGKKAFERRLHTRQEMFTISLPRIVLKNMNWQALIHGKGFIAKQMNITAGKLNVYLNKSLPSAKTPVKMDNFPQQMLMDIPLPIAVDAILVQKMDVSYEEYSPDAAESGVITINSINGHGEYLSNIPANIVRHPAMQFAGNALFMDKAPMNAAFSFALPDAQHGAFTADINMSGLEGAWTNSFAAPLGGIRFTSGYMGHGAAHIQGNNYHITGDLLVQYDHLHIDQIRKKARNETGDFKKQSLLSFIGNAVLIKNANPGRFGKLRKSQIALDRKESGNFFNFSWSAVKSGLLKTIGVPQKLGM